jgi:hypothetical protein
LWVVRTNPFTIRLTYTTHYTQPVSLGINAGYSMAGFSAVFACKELIACECKLLEGQVDRNKDRSKYRRERGGPETVPRSPVRQPQEAGRLACAQYPKEA